MSFVIASLALWGQTVFAQHPQQYYYPQVPRPSRPPYGAPGYNGNQAYPTPYPGAYSGDEYRMRRVQGLIVKFFTDSTQSCTNESLTSIIFTGNTRIDTDMCRGLQEMGREKISNLEINGVCQKLEPVTNPISACLRVLASFYEDEYR